MEQRHLVLVDEQSQTDRLNRIAASLKNDGIELIYQEIDPSVYQKRLDSGDVTFDKDTFIQAIKDVPFIHHLDMLATDYNLIEGQLKGIDVIRFFTEIKPYFSKSVIIYSAQIEGVIGDILKGGEDQFEEQCAMLKLLARYDIDYLKSEGVFENKFKSLLEKEPDITIDARMIESMQAINSDTIHCSIPPYKNKTIAEIGQLLQSKDSRAIALRKEITDHIMAIVTDVEEYE